MKVVIEGVGTFNVKEECVSQLIDILNRYSAVRISEHQSNPKFEGRDLLNG